MYNSANIVLQQVEQTASGTVQKWFWHGILALEMVFSRARMLCLVVLSFRHPLVQSPLIDSVLLSKDLLFDVLAEAEMVGGAVILWSERVV